MTRAEALKLVKEKIQNQNLIKHCLAVEAIMKAMAVHLNQEVDAWSLAGLLHDIDYEETKDDPQNHSLKGGEMLKELGLPDEIVRAVKAHNEIHGLPRESLLDKVLYAVDPLSGFITAVALVYPSKKLADVKIKSITKRLKENRFAAGASRQGMKSIEDAGLTFEQFAEIGLKAMQEISEDLSL
ncbi:HDIG domain-containing protein [Patescibacteria group bacterium]|nr:HDIG domain-containing protein [Patescibacteria group bacterium]